jgi:hypothetical protein
LRELTAASPPGLSIIDRAKGVTIEKSINRALLVLCCALRDFWPGCWVRLGDLAMMTSTATAVAVWVEYGFGISALRAISSADPADRGGIWIGVTTAKFALFASVGLALAVATICFPAISQFPGGLGLVTLFGATQAFSPARYFLGTGRATVSAVMDGFAALIWFIPAFFIVRSASDVNLVIAWQRAAQAVLVLIAHAIAFTELKRFSVNWRKVIGQLTTGVPKAAQRCGASPSI